MVYLTRVEHFNAAHRLFNPGWSREKNEAVFGKCANENWHGHNYELFVTIKGDPDPDTGFLFDAKKLSGLIKDLVLEKLDHRNLNIEVDFLAGKICSTENLAIGIWEQLAPRFTGNVQLHGIKLYETPRIFVEYFG
jgi:6-pyruvoyltetrahydropterin/6-carboxytetrahydropterin synthase